MKQYREHSFKTKYHSKQFEKQFDVKDESVLRYNMCKTENTK